MKLIALAGKIMDDTRLLKIKSNYFLNTGLLHCDELLSIRLNCVAQIVSTGSFGGLSQEPIVIDAHERSFCTSIPCQVTITPGDKKGSNAVFDEKNSNVVLTIELCIEQSSFNKLIKLNDKPYDAQLSIELAIQHNDETPFVFDGYDYEEHVFQIGIRNITAEAKNKEYSQLYFEEEFIKSNLKAAWNFSQDLPSRLKETPTITGEEQLPLDKISLIEELYPKLETFALSGQLEPQNYCEEIGEMLSFIDEIEKHLTVKKELTEKQAKSLTTRNGYFPSLKSYDFLKDSETWPIAMGLHQVVKWYLSHDWVSSPKLDAILLKASIYGVMLDNKVWSDSKSTLTLFGLFMKFSWRTLVVSPALLLALAQQGAIASAYLLFLIYVELKLLKHHDAVDSSDVFNELKRSIDNLYVPESHPDIETLRIAQSHFNKSKSHKDSFVNKTIEGTMIEMLFDRAISR